jgi:hypothetical protein
MTDSVAAATNRAADQDVGINLAKAIPAMRKVNTALSLRRASPEDRFDRSGTRAHLDRSMSKVGASGCGLFWYNTSGEKGGARAV